MKDTMRRHRVTAGFSFIELMIVLVLMTIVAAMVIPDSNPNVVSQLSSAAQVLQSDLAYCQSLSVTHNSTFRIQFNIDTDTYYLEHTGTDTALDTLPNSIYGDNPKGTRRTMRFSDHPLTGAGVRVVSVQAIAAQSPTVTDVEYGPLGGATRAEGTAIWLTAGQSTAQRFLPVYVDATTGLTRVGEVVAISPVNIEIVVQPI